MGKWKKTKTGLRWNPNDIPSYFKNYYQKNKKKMLKNDKKWRKNNKAKYTLYLRNHFHKLRLQIIDHYTQSQRKCMCLGCNESHIEFLSIDHINGGGNKQRKKIGFGSDTYYWIIKHDFPEEFQILCHNCNLAKGFYGICPHLKI